jgi:hypothetical protein
MKHFGKNRMVLFALAALVLFSVLLLPSSASANSAQPPAILVIALNAPNDLALEGEVNGEFVPMRFSSVAWESYYKLHYFDYPTGDTRGVMPTAIRVTTGGASGTLSLPNMAKTYDNVFTLDCATMTLTEGTLPFRSTLLVAMRVALTLVLEGLVFYLFGFRQKRSWIAFFVINLITQGGLNAALSEAAFTNGYAILGLILLEILVFLVEIPAFLIALKEKKWWQRLIYVLIANVLSLVLGGALISYLPI